MLDISVEAMLEPSNLSLKLFILIDFSDIKGFLEIVSVILIFKTGVFLFTDFLALLNAVIMHDIIEVGVMLRGFVILVDRCVMLLLNKRLLF